MSHRYIRLMNCNCNCNSNAYRSSRTSSGGDTLIFNFNSCCNNIPTAHCGGFWGGFGNMWSGLGGFWGGVGAGLGFGAIGLGMNWLFGGIRNLCVSGQWGNPLQDFYGGRAANPYGNYGGYHPNNDPWGNSQIGRGGSDVGTDRATVSGTPTPASQTPTSVVTAGASGETSISATPAGPADDEVTINGANKKISELTADDIAILSKNELDKIKSDGNLPKILGQLGAKEIDAATISLPSTMDAKHLSAIKKISDELNLNVAVANNPKAGKDQWVKGKLGDISDNNGKLSYTIDCDGVGAYGLKYDVVQNENGNWTLSLHGSGGKEVQAETKDGKKVKVTPKDYTFNSGIGCLYKEGPVLTSELNVK